MSMFGGTIRLTTAAALVVLTTTAAASVPQNPQWKVTSFHVTMAVQNDAKVQVAETIVFDFGTAPGHGITDPITLIPGYVDGAPPAVSNVTVTVDDVTAPQPAQTATTKSVTLAIGDPNATITGVHTYHVAYTITGAVYAVDGTSGTAALLWPLINGDWDVPISDAQVTLTMPGEVQYVQCWGGEPTSGDRCHDQSFHGAVASYTQLAIPAGQGFAVRAVAKAGAVVGLPAGTPVDYPSKSAATSADWGGPTIVIVLLVTGLIVTVFLWVFRLHMPAPSRRTEPAADTLSNDYSAGSAAGYTGYSGHDSGGGGHDGGHGGGW